MEDYKHFHFWASLRMHCFHLSPAFSHQGAWVLSEFWVFGMTWKSGFLLYYRGSRSLLKRSLKQTSEMLMLWANGQSHFSDRYTISLLLLTKSLNEWSTHSLTFPVIFRSTALSAVPCINQSQQFRMNRFVHSQVFLFFISFALFLYFYVAWLAVCFL